MDLAAYMPAVAQAVLGEPNRALSTAREMRFGSNGSLKVDVERGTWYSHEEKEGGGVLDFIKHYKKLEGSSAFDFLREIGCDIEEPRPRQNGAHPNGQHRGADQQQAERVFDETYSYTDEDGRVLYQAIRCIFRLPDGSFLKDDTGKRKKTFLQRRPDPDKPNEWSWKVKGARLVPYRLADLIDAIASDHTIYIVEGERKVDALRKLGLTATCNVGGSGKWTPELTPFFAGARVVILPDNDAAGRKHADQVGAALADVAPSVMVLELPDLPQKGDVIDWIAEGGTAEELAELGTQARPWVPREDLPWDDGAGEQQTPHAPRFRLVHFGDVKVTTRPRYLVRGIVPLTGLVVIWGPPKCGKSFWTSDLLFHVALGWSYRGRRVEQGPVVYVILEGETGFSDRIEAFRQKHLRDHDKPVPFYIVSQKLNLVADHQQLIADIRAQLPAGVTPAAVAIDTLNRSLQGSESSDQDMGNYVKAADAVRTAFDCVVPIVHHCGIESARPRGHSSLTGAADAQIAVRRDMQKNVVTRVEYMKDGPEGDELVSRLEVLTVGHEPDGHPITSCVVAPLGDDEARTQKSAAEGFNLSPSEEPIFRALMDARRTAGRYPDAEMIALGVPDTAKAVHYRDWRDAYKIVGKGGGADGEPPSDDTIRKRFDRNSGFMIGSNVIGWKRPWLWWTGRHVKGFAETRPTDPESRTKSGQWSDKALGQTGFFSDAERTETGHAGDDPEADALR